MAINFKGLEKVLKSYGVATVTVYKVLDNEDFELVYGDRLSDESQLPKWANLKQSLINNNEKGLIGDKQYYGRAVVLLPKMDGYKHILVMRSKSRSFLATTEEVGALANVIENFKHKMLHRNRG